MITHDWARIIGWAVACYVGGGLLFAVCSPLIQIIVGSLLSPAGVAWFYLGVPLAFALASIFHDLTGKLEGFVRGLRRSSILALWVFAFYLGTIAVALLGLIIPYAGYLVLFVAFAPFAGGIAGSLCWHGKLPGTGKNPTANNSRSCGGGEASAIPHAGNRDLSQVAVRENRSAKSG